MDETAASEIAYERFRSESSDEIKQLRNILRAIRKAKNLEEAKALAFAGLL